MRKRNRQLVDALVELPTTKQKGPKVERITLTKGDHKVAVQVETLATGGYRAGFVHFLEHGTAAGVKNVYPTLAEAQKQRDLLIAELGKRGFTTSARSGRKGKVAYQTIDDLMKVIK